jgi:autotransporter-associated beta strand protein
MSRLPIYALLLAISSAALVFNQGGDATFSSVISGSLTKTGAGTPMLDGTNTYTGSTTISAGTLEVSDSNTTTGSIQGAVDVQGGGTLRGHGTIVGNITSDGIVWPGGSMGTLTSRATTRKTQAARCKSTWRQRKPRCSRSPTPPASAAHAI